MALLAKRLLHDLGTFKAQKRKNEKLGLERKIRFL